MLFSRYKNFAIVMPANVNRRHQELRPGVGQGMPRPVEVVLASAGLLLCLPVLLVAMLAIRLTSKGPAIFRQGRVGRNGNPFTLYKLRTMRTDNRGIQVTAASDARMTPVGRLFRKTKIDELPELWNIVKGDMALVGPRPEVPRYVDLKNRQWRQVLHVRPGITDPMTLQLRNEEELLAQVKEDRESFYLATLQPYKLNGYLEYLKQRTWQSDVKVLLSTVVAVFLPGCRPAPTVEDIRSLS